MALEGCECGGVHVVEEWRQINCMEEAFECARVQFRLLMN